MKTVKILLTLLAIGGLLWSGCSKKEIKPTTNVYSVNGGTSSHKNGTVCMDCHNSTATVTYQWVVAGSVYKADHTTAAPNGVIYFWTNANGTGDIISTLEIDANGNFFTNVSILPGLGAYPQLRGFSGDIKNMPVLATTGNCNSCHGVSDDPIWVN